MIRQSSLSCNLTNLIVKPSIILLDEEIDAGASSDEDVSDNEFSSNKSSGGVQKRKRGFSFDFDDGEVISPCIDHKSTSRIDILAFLMHIFSDASIGSWEAHGCQRESFSKKGKTVRNYRQ